MVDIPEAPADTMVCPLTAVAAGTDALLDADDLPATLQVTFIPPILPTVAIELLGEEAHIPLHAGQRLQQLPYNGSLIYGEDPDVGLITLTITPAGCQGLELSVVEASPPEGVHCALGDEVPVDLVRRVVYASGPWAGRSISMQPHGGGLVLEDVPETGDGWVHLHTGTPIPFSWDPDGCDDLIPVGSAHVQVIVTNPPPVGAVRVRGCGQLRRLPPTQSAIELEIPAIPCALEAWRYDGALRALSPLATVDLSPNEHQTVELTLPEEEVAGLGVRFLPGDAFVEVLAVVPDSPAWDAGLRDGDRILSVDDEPVGGLEASDFIAIGTGPVGTEARLVLESEDGGRETVSLERAPVSNPVN
jgi:hypothetical protein